MPQARISHWLAWLGLEVLLRRFAMTIAIPLGLLAVNLVTAEIAWRALR